MCKTVIHNRIKQTYSSFFYKKKIKIEFNNTQYILRVKYKRWENAEKNEEMVILSTV